MSPADVLASLGAGLAVTAVWVVLLWLIGIVRRDVSVIDAVFSLIVVSTVVVGGVVVGDPYGPRAVLIVGLLGLWSARLTAYLTWRKWGEGEDPRYTRLRSWTAEGLPFHLLALRRVFGLQGAVLYLLSVPAVVAVASPTPTRLGPWSVAGTLVWAVGFVFESVGDHQLVRFRRDPANRGRVLDTGLWRYTAHPNYFGEIVMAWGVFLACLDVRWALLGVPGPVLYTRLILTTTGTPTLEKRLRRTRPGYAEYLERTSSFWPRPPRRRD